MRQRMHIYNSGASSATHNTMASPFTINSTHTSKDTITVGDNPQFAIEVDMELYMSLHKNEVTFSTYDWNRMTDLIRNLEQECEARRESLGKATAELEASKRTIAEQEEALIALRDRLKTYDEDITYKEVFESGRFTHENTAFAARKVVNLPGPQFAAVKKAPPARINVRAARKDDDAEEYSSEEDVFESGRFTRKQKCTFAARKIWHPVHFQAVKKAPPARKQKCTFAARKVVNLPGPQYYYVTETAPEIEEIEEID